MGSLDPVDLARQTAPLLKRVAVKITNRTRERAGVETMPYEGDAKLPAAVQKLPAGKQAQWRAVFNSVMKRTGNESRAFASAWSVVGGAPKDKEAGEHLLHMGPGSHPSGSSQDVHGEGGGGGSQKAGSASTGVSHEPGPKGQSYNPHFEREATKYVNAIRNPAKRMYAKALLAYMLGRGEKPSGGPSTLEAVQGPALGLMARQAVRLRLETLWHVGPEARARLKQSELRPTAVRKFPPNPWGPSVAKRRGALTAARARREVESKIGEPKAGKGMPRSIPPTTISSPQDLTAWVAGHSKSGVAVADLTKWIHDHPRRPAWGTDWSGFLKMLDRQNALSEPREFVASEPLADPMAKIIGQFHLSGSRRLMMFPRGEFKHPQYGTMAFDDGFFQEIKDNFDDQVLGHTRPFIDVDHNHGAACGWINHLSVEPDGMYADVEWTPLGEQLVGSKQYQYFSPWWGSYKDPASGKVYDRVLRGGGLTNVPFLKVLPPVELYEPGIPSPARELAFSGGREFKLSEITPVKSAVLAYPTDRAEKLRRAFAEQFAPVSGQGPASRPAWIIEINEKSVVAGFEEGTQANYYRIPFVETPESVTFLAEKKKSVKRTWSLSEDLHPRLGVSAVAHALQETQMTRLSQVFAGRTS